jgi:hypothetical protein
MSTFLPYGYRFLAWGSLIISGASLLWIGLTHLTYPGFAETMEGDLLQQIERIANGERPYPGPESGAIPLTYMPLYSYLSAGLYCLFGDSFVGPRLISLFAAIFSAMWIWQITRHETNCRHSAALATAIFCASYRVMDAALFTVHPDSLLLFFLLTGYWHWAYGQSVRSDLLWLLCFTLAFWTKQHGALFFGWAVLYALLFRQNSLPRWGILVGIALGGTIAYFGIGSLLGESFFFHTLQQPTQWEQSWWNSIRRLIFVLALLAPVGFVVFLEYARSVRVVQRWRPTPLLWFLATGLITAIYTMRITGASNNHYAPLHALWAVTLVIIVRRALRTTETLRLHLHLLFAGMTLAASGVTFVAMRSFAQHPIPSQVPFLLLGGTFALFLIRRLPKERRLVWEAGVVLTMQFAVIAFNPLNYLPASGFQKTLSDFQEELKRLPAPVVWIDYGNVPEALTGVKLLRMPSWVALEDIDRQLLPREAIDAHLAPWKQRVESMPELYLLSFDRLEKVPVWNQLKDQFELHRDYGERFRAIKQIAEHWYGAGGAPRYLYQKKTSNRE